MNDEKIDKERLIAAAEKLGLEIEFNSKNPGFSYNDTGKIYSWKEIAENVKERFKR